MPNGLNTIDVNESRTGSTRHLPWRRRISLGSLPLCVPVVLVDVAAGRQGSTEFAIADMTGTSITVAGIEIPSSDPLFLAVVAVHVLLGLACAVTGIIAMLSAKRVGRHPWFGTVYYCCLVGVFVTASGLAAVRWAEDYHLFILGSLAFATGYLGRAARRKRWTGWVKLHIAGMGTSYILLLTAFYVDNGKNLPLWRELPPLAYWLTSAVVGIPLNCSCAPVAPVVTDIATAFSTVVHCKWGPPYQERRPT
jgi:hypothetical protein